jgi:hypothetical protein
MSRLQRLGDVRTAPRRADHELGLNPRGKHDIMRRVSALLPPPAFQKPPESV